VNFFLSDFEAPVTHASPSEDAAHDNIEAAIGLPNSRKDSGDA